jgi:hypothetical protein
MDLELTTIWHRSALGTGCVADAIAARAVDPAADVTGLLAEAAERSSKNAIELRQLLASMTRGGKASPATL